MVTTSRLLFLLPKLVDPLVRDRAWRISASAPTQNRIVKRFVQSVGIGSLLLLRLSFWMKIQVRKTETLHCVLKILSSLRTVEGCLRISGGDEHMPIGCLIREGYRVRFYFVPSHCHNFRYKERQTPPKISDARPEQGQIHGTLLSIIS